MNTGHLSSIFANLGLGLGLLLALPASWAADNFTAFTAADSPTQAKKPKRAQAPKPPAIPNSGESKSERDKRLLRECKGKPNAGVCEGYGS